jgi:hypothetical protein
LVIGITNGLYKLRPLKNSLKTIDRIPQDKLYPSNLVPKYRILEKKTFTEV